MFKLILITLLIVPLISSCKKGKSNGLSQNSKCQALPPSFLNSKSGGSRSIEYMAGGCEEFSGDFPGKNSTVFLWNGNGTCTGTVISEHFIITAAHCLKKFPDPSEMNIVIGDNAFDLFNNSVIKVKNYFVNPIYNDIGNKQLIKNNIMESSLGDISLIQTESNLVKNYAIIPVKTTRTIVEDEEILSIGYGFTGKYNKETGGLKRWAVASKGQVILDPLYTEVFNLFYKTLGKYVDLTSFSEPQKTFLITDKKKISHGQTCYGDSGGPQFVMRNNQLALISETQGINPYLQKFSYMPTNDDCNEMSTSLNTLIAPYYNWINQKMTPFGERLESVD